MFQSKRSGRFVFFISSIAAGYDGEGFWEIILSRAKLSFDFLA
jgi:hypothetical protein